MPNDAARIIAAERFIAGCDALCGVVVPPDLPLGGAGSADILVIREATGERRRVHAAPADAVRAAGGHIDFPAFASAAGEMFRFVVALHADGTPADHLLQPFEAPAMAQRPPIVLECQAAPLPVATEDGTPLACTLDAFWCNAGGVYVKGTLRVAGGTVERVRLSAGREPGEAVLAEPGPSGSGRGFEAWLPWRPGTPVTLEASTADACHRAVLALPDRPAPLYVPAPAGSETEDLPEDRDVLWRFRDEVNRQRLVVAELGARAVSRNWWSERALMTGAARYIGIDIHPGENVDVVGDAHALHELVGEAALDAVFSLSVLEHLAHPWLLAASVNRALRIGGLTLHVTHQTWPLHEPPNDFWRFSHEGLQLLFGPATGFSVLRAGMARPVRVYPDGMRREDWAMPLGTAYGGAYVLARKVADIPADAVAWPGGGLASLRRAQSYPVPNDP